MTIAMTEADDTFWSVMRTLEALPRLEEATPGTIIGVGATTWLVEDDDRHRLMIESPRLLYASTVAIPAEASLSEWVRSQRLPPFPVLDTYTALIEGTFSIDPGTLPWIWTAYDGFGRRDIRTLWALQGGVAILPNYHEGVAFNLDYRTHRSGIFHPKGDTAHARLAIRTAAHQVRDQAAQVLSSVGYG